MKIGFLGAGHLGGAIIQGLLHSKKYHKEDFKVVVGSDSSLQKYQQDGFQVSKDWSSLADCEVVLLALRPDVIKEQQEQLKKSFSKQIIISVAAGVTLAFLQDLFPDAALAIAMPNTACQFNQSMTMVAAESQAEAIIVAQELFNLLGATIVLPVAKIHTFIAICGSASAYIYYWLEPLMKMALASQISVADSKKILAGLLNGAAANIEHSAVSLAELAKQVSVPGGTTIEALKVFDERKVSAIIAEAIAAVAQRSAELS